MQCKIQNDSYDFDHHKFSAAIVFVIINYTNSALSALDRLQHANMHIPASKKFKFFLG